VRPGEPLTYVGQRLGHDSPAFTLASTGTCSPAPTAGR